MPSRLIQLNGMNFNAGGSIEFRATKMSVCNIDQGRKFAKGISFRRSKVFSDQASNTPTCIEWVEPTATRRIQGNAHDQIIADKIQRGGSRRPIRQTAAWRGRRIIQTFENDRDHEAQGAQEKAAQAGNRRAIRDRMKAALCLPTHPALSRACRTERYSKANCGLQFFRCSRSIRVCGTCS
jgi:hypothetical protein